MKKVTRASSSSAKQPGVMEKPCQIPEGDGNVEELTDCMYCWDFFRFLRAGT